jgi:tubulin delta
MLDIIRHLCSHPGFRLTTLKTIPQIATATKQFTSLSWPYLMKHLMQMQIADSPTEEGIDWSIKFDGISSRMESNSLAFLCIDAHHLFMFWLPP